VLLLRHAPPVDASHSEILSAHIADGLAVCDQAALIGEAAAGGRLRTLWPVALCGSGADQREAGSRVTALNNTTNVARLNRSLMNMSSSLCLREAAKR